MRALVFQVNPVGWITCQWLRHLRPMCVLGPAGGLRLRELPPPPLPGPDWVRCRTRLGGICGTDLAIIALRQPADSILQCFTTLPAVFGHENVAVVEEVGPEVDPKWIGRRVTVEPTLCCRVRGIEPECPSCAAGQYGACQNFSAAGAGRSKLPPGTSIGYCGAVGGAWGEEFVAHSWQLVEPPAAMPDRLAVLTDPLACSLHAVLRADLTLAGRVLVVGAGILGLGVVWALRARGWTGQLDVVVRHAHQAALAEKLGATQALVLPRDRRQRFAMLAERSGARVTRARFGNLMLSGGYDIVFDCVGSPPSLEESFKFARSRGQVVLVGTGHGRGADLTPLWFTELTVMGAYGRGLETDGRRRLHTYALAHELMLAHGAHLAGLLTHTFPLSEYRQALATAMNKSGTGAVKVAFEFERSFTPSTEHGTMVS